MSRWFRFYDDALNDPKVQMLEPVLFKTWVNLLCIASRNDGKLPTLHEIAYLLRVNETEVKRFIETFQEHGLVDLTSDGTLEPHNWRGRQFKSDVSTQRVRDHRKHKRNVSSTVPETPPETETETERKKERGATAPPSYNSSSHPDEPIVDPSIAERELYQRGKQVLGPKAGGLIRRIVLAKGGNISLARAAIEQASTKQDPLEYAAAVARGPPPDRPMSLKDRQQEAWDNARRKLKESIALDEREASRGSDYGFLPAISSERS